MSTKKEMNYIFTKLNGLILIKVKRFKEACDCYNIPFIKGNYNIQAFDPYLSGLVDTDGSIVFNYSANRIECNIELKDRKESLLLNLDNVIPQAKPSVLLRTHTTKGKTFKSIAFKYQNVAHMLPLYQYFLFNRLYSDFKFFRVTKIRKFIEIRKYHKYDKTRAEYKLYSDFMLK